MMKAIALKNETEAGRGADAVQGALPALHPSVYGSHRLEEVK